MKPTRLALAAITAVAVTATLSGCLQWFLPPVSSNTSQPTGEEVAPELQPFYDQVLEWTSCGNGMQCATATAPMYWENPADAEIELALVRHQATGTRL